MTKIILTFLRISTFKRHEDKMKKNKYNFLKLLVVVFSAVFQYCSAAAFDLRELSNQLYAAPGDARTMAEILRDFSIAVGGTDSDPSPKNIETYRRVTNAAVTKGVYRLRMIDHASRDAIWITSRLALFLGSIPAEHTWLTIVSVNGGVEKPLHVETIARTAITNINGDLAALNTDGPDTNIFKVSQMFCAAASIFPEMLENATAGQIHALESSIFDGVSTDVDAYSVFETSILEADRRSAILEATQLREQALVKAPKESWGSFLGRHSLSFLTGAAVVVTAFMISKSRR